MNFKCELEPEGVVGATGFNPLKGYRTTRVHVLALLRVGNSSMSVATTGAGALTDTVDEWPVKRVQKRQVH